MEGRFDEERFERMVEEEQTRRELSLISEIEPEVNGIFECHKITEQVMKALQDARADGASTEEFYSEYLSGIQYCHCENGSCTWPLENVVDSLGDVQDLIEEYLTF